MSDTYAQLRNQIEAINDLTDIRVVVALRRRLNLLNIADPRSHPVLVAAREKGL